MLLFTYLIGTGKKYVVDLDGTILVRGSAITSSLNTIEHMLECDFFQENSFERRGICFVFERVRYPIWFRAGTVEYLKFLSDDGKNQVYFATHACPKYAERIVALLRRIIPNCRFYVKTYSKGSPKIVLEDMKPYEFILDDKPSRWENDTQRIIRIDSLVIDNIAEDNKLWIHMAYVHFYRAHLFGHDVDPGVALSIVQFIANSPIPEMWNCPHCQAWMPVPANENTENTENTENHMCGYCSLHRDSDTSNESSPL